MILDIAVMLGMAFCNIIVAKDTKKGFITAREAKKNWWSALICDLGGGTLGINLNSGLFYIHVDSPWLHHLKLNKISFDFQTQVSRPFNCSYTWNKQRLMGVWWSDAKRRVWRAVMELLDERVCSFWQSLSWMCTAVEDFCFAILSLKAENKNFHNILLIF